MAPGPSSVASVRGTPFAPQAHVFDSVNTMGPLKHPLMETEPRVDGTGFGCAAVSVSFPSYQGNALAAPYTPSSQKGVEALTITKEEIHELYNSRHFDACRRAAEAFYRAHPRDTINLLLLGGACFQLGDYDGSLHYNKLVLELEPGNTHALCNVGNSYMELNDLSNSLSFYLMCVRKQPSFEVDVIFNIVRNFSQRGATDAAVMLLQAYLEANPRSAPAYYQLGMMYFSENRLAEAKVHLNEAIIINPRMELAWSLLGVIYNSERDHNQAIHAYKCAIAVNPQYADAYNNVANIYKEIGMIDDAISMYKQALRVKPSFAICHSNLASAYYDLHKVDQAIESYKRAIELDPTHADAHNNIGNIYKGKGMTNEAIECYRKALSVLPTHCHALNNLGNTFKDLGNIKDALQCYETAVSYGPKFAPLYNNYASLLKDCGRLHEATWYYQESLRIDPTLADAQSNLGNTLRELGRTEEAIACYKKAIQLNPNLADSYGNLAATQKDSGDLVNAIENYKKALELRPGFPEAFANLVHSLQFICAWDGLDEMFKQLFEAQLDHIAKNLLPPVQPFHAMVYPMDPVMQLKISRIYAQRAHENMAMVLPILRREFESAPVIRQTFADGSRERIRVGYVSSDFGNHPLAHLMQSVFGMHNRQLFEIFCFSLSPSDNSQWRQKIMTGAEHFIDISGQSKENAARMIRKERIHILVNLNGYTKGARTEIFAASPSPVQVSYMGFAGSMGADYIHYLITDETVSPPDRAHQYAEKLVWMPNCYFVNDYVQSYMDSVTNTASLTRMSCGLPEGKFIFANFNQLYKIDPGVFDVWCRILLSVPNSVLWLLRFPAVGEENIRREAAKRGVPQDQLIFTDVAHKAEHIRRSALANLFLDTPLCNAHTTGTDVLWAGLPILTCPQEKMSSRVAASLVQAVGAPELVVSSLDEYEKKARSFALNPNGELANIRKKIMNNRMTCPLFDTKRWVRDIEVGYAKMWEVHESGLPPQHIAVADRAEETLQKLQGETINARVEPTDLSNEEMQASRNMVLMRQQPMPTPQVAHYQQPHVQQHPPQPQVVMPAVLPNPVTPGYMPMMSMHLVDMESAVAAGAVLGGNVSGNQWQNIPSAGMDCWHNVTLWNNVPNAPQWHQPIVDQNAWMQGSGPDNMNGLLVYHLPVPSQVPVNTNSPGAFSPQVDGQHVPHQGQPVPSTEVGTHGLMHPMGTGATPMWGVPPTQYGLAVAGAFNPAQAQPMYYMQDNNRQPQSGFL